MSARRSRGFKQEDVIIDYTDPIETDSADGKVVSYFNYEVKLPAKSSALDYLVSDFVGKVEEHMVKSPGDPVYKASVSIARQVADDKTVSSVIALGIYYFLSEFSQKNGGSGVNDKRPERLKGGNED
jgi:hypothetical protein